MLLALEMTYKFNSVSKLEKIVYYNSISLRTHLTKEEFDPEADTLGTHFYLVLNNSLEIPGYLWYPEIGNSSKITITFNFEIFNVILKLLSYFLLTMTIFFYLILYVVFF